MQSNQTQNHKQLDQIRNISTFPTYNRWNLNQNQMFTTLIWNEINQPHHYIIFSTAVHLHFLRNKKIKYFVA